MSATQTSGHRLGSKESSLCIFISVHLTCTITNTQAQKESGDALRNQELNLNSLCHVKLGSVGATVVQLSVMTGNGRAALQSKKLFNAE